MKSLLAIFACISAVMTSEIAAAHPQTGNRAKVVVGTASVSPEVTKLIRMGVDPEVARMIVSSRPTPAYAKAVSNASVWYEWRNTLDAVSGVPPRFSGSTLVKPMVDRTSSDVRHKAGLDLPRF